MKFRCKYYNEGTSPAKLFTINVRLDDLVYSGMEHYSLLRSNPWKLERLLCGFMFQLFLLRYQAAT